MLLGACVGLIAATTPAVAEPFKAASECVAGKRVADQAGKTGTVVRITQTTMCEVKTDAHGESHYYLFWMLHAAGGSAETNDRLVPGTYECFAGGRYTFMDMRITGPNSYVAAGTPGAFRVYPSRKIVFLSGSLSKYHAKLLAGPAIGLNTDGGSFYATTCELRK